MTPSTDAEPLAPNALWGGTDQALHAFIYQRLHELAHHRLQRGPRFAQTTSLVHEAYLRMVPTTKGLTRAHFFAVAATVMRNILVDRARAAHSAKRDGGIQVTALDSNYGDVNADDPAALLQVDNALARVRSVDPNLATLVELKVFCGLDVSELADALDVSERTVKRHWRQARALLVAEFG